MEALRVLISNRIEKLENARLTSRYVNPISTVAKFTEEFNKGGVRSIILLISFTINVSKLEDGFFEV